jgi:hypothetical protein
MSLAFRAVRNLWHEVEGVFTKYVNKDDIDLDYVDFNDECLENQGIGSAAWEDTSGVTLVTTTPTWRLVQFTHTGTGSAVLQVVLDYTAYLATLATKYLIADNYIMLDTEMGQAKSAGESAMLHLRAGTDPESIVGLDGKYALLVGLASGNNVLIGPLVANGSYYDGVLLDDLVFGDVSAVPDYAFVGSDPDTFIDEVAERAIYAAKPTRTIHKKLAFVDPSNPTDDGYTP